jgi:hypothetical protein
MALRHLTQAAVVGRVPQGQPLQKVRVAAQAVTEPHRPSLAHL